MTAKRKYVLGLTGILVAMGLIVALGTFGVYAGFVPFMTVSSILIAAVFVGTALFVIQSARKKKAIAERLVSGRCLSCGFDSACNPAAVVLNVEQTSHRAVG